LDKEVSSVLSEVSDLSSKQDHAEKYDVSRIDGLESSVTDLTTKVDAALQSTAKARTGDPTTAANYHPKETKGKRKFLLFHSGGSGQYDEMLSTVKPGRDRELFQEAAKEVRKGSYDTGRLLFNTIVTAYPDSPYLPMAKLAIADSFYLEGTTGSLIQAAQAYQDWITFFPTDPLADAAMLRVAEAEMRQMGLPDRQYQHAVKAEQRLKALLQQYPQTKLRPEVEARLQEVQDNLAAHDKNVGDFYWQRYQRHAGGLKGAQYRYKEIVEKYPNFSCMDDVLFRLAATYQEEEEPDEAAKFYQRVLREFPQSDFAVKAKDQLNVIGAAIPEPDPNRKDARICEKPTFVQNFKQQLTGTPDITTNHEGILITHKGKGDDLIDVALTNNGSVPQPVIDRAMLHQGDNQPNPTPENAPDKKTAGSQPPLDQTTRPRTAKPEGTPTPLVKQP
jgi:outer membrane protein assembly factor BamD